jgi:hypothetical protein
MSLFTVFCYTSGNSQTLVDKSAEWKSLKGTDPSFFEARKARLILLFIVNYLSPLQSLIILAGTRRREFSSF